MATGPSGAEHARAFHREMVNKEKEKGKGKNGTVGIRGRRLGGPVFMWLDSRCLTPHTAVDAEA